MRTMNIPDVPTLSFQQSIAVARGFKKQRAPRRSRRNPVGAGSNVDLIDAETLKAIKGRMFPGAETASQAASKGYPSFYRTHTMSGGKALPTGLLSLILNGSTEIQQAEFKLDRIGTWTGGYDFLNSLGTDGMSDLAGTPFTIGTLAPYTYDNPSGNGVYQAIAEKLREGSVRGDEAYVASSLIKLMGKVVASKVTGKGDYAKFSPADVKTLLNAYFTYLVLVIFGVEDSASIEKISRAGISSIEGTRSEREQRRAGGTTTKPPGVNMDAIARARAAAAERIRQRAAGGAAFVSTPVPAAPTPAEVRAAAQAAVAPVPTIQKVEEAAAAVTAPVTEASPAGAVASGALQSLLALGISREDAEWIMSLPRSERITAMRVAMGN